MKSILRKLFRPILSRFEKQQSTENYKPSHRIVLNVVGGLFLFLSCSTGWAAFYSNDIGFYIPVVIFFIIGFVSLIVGTLGKDCAVARIWGNR